MGILRSALSLLSDRDIQRLLADGGLGITPFNPKHLTPNGYDLTVGEILVPAAAGRGDLHTTTGEARVPPLTRFLVSTAECVALGPAVAAQLWIRSTWARRGVLASFGKVEAGFEGTLTIGCFHGNADGLAVPVGDRFCQIAFETLTSEPEALYAKRSGTYQGQRGVTLPRG